MCVRNSFEHVNKYRNEYRMSSLECRNKLPQAYKLCDRSFRTF